MGYSSITRSERDIVPVCLCQKVGNIIGSVDSTRGALARQVSPAGELVESAAKKRQCDSSTGRRSATSPPSKHQPQEAGLEETTTPV